MTKKIKLSPISKLDQAEDLYFSKRAEEVLARNEPTYTLEEIAKEYGCEVKEYPPLKVGDKIWYVNFIDKPPYYRIDSTTITKIIVTSKRYLIEQDGKDLGAEGEDFMIEDDLDVGIFRTEQAALKWANEGLEDYVKDIKKQIAKIEKKLKSTL